MTDQSILEEGVDLGSLERQVIQADLELKRQELDHRSREQSNRDLEIELKRASAAASRWTSPLVVAVFAAAVAGLSNATVSIINGRSTRNLEESKSESERILEVIKTGGDTEKAAENLRFLIRSGLVSSHPTVDNLRKYLSNRKPGTGVTLPSVSDTFTIKKSPAIAETVRSDLSSRLGYFVAYLAKIGFQPPSSKIDITFLKNEEINAFYSPEENNIQIGPRIAADPHIGLAVYAEYAMLSTRSKSDFQDAEYLFLDKAMSDYLSSSFLSNPKVGSIVATVVDNKIGYLRNLDNSIRYSEVLEGKIREPHEIGEVWGGALWAIRSKIGRARFDPVLVSAWKSFKKRSNVSLSKCFLDEILASSDRTLTASEATVVHTVFDTRGFPVGFVPKSVGEDFF